MASLQEHIMVCVIGRTVVLGALQLQDDSRPEIDSINKVRGSVKRGMQKRAKSIGDRR